MHGETGDMIIYMVRKPQGKKLLGRLRCRWVGDIKIDLGETGCRAVNCIQLAQDRVLSWAFVNINILVSSKKGIS
jgi:hypothetical protein